MIADVVDVALFQCPPVYYYYYIQLPFEFCALTFGRDPSDTLLMVVVGASGAFHFGTDCGERLNLLALNVLGKVVALLRPSVRKQIGRGGKK